MVKKAARENLPYARSFLERVPLRFINLDELTRGALENRDLAGDAYWCVESQGDPLAYLVLRLGRPHQLIGHPGPALVNFLRWIRTDKRELTLTYRFVEEETLKYLMRCWTEEPVLENLDHSSGDIRDLLQGLKRTRESGLLGIRNNGNLSLIPIENGRISICYTPGRMLNSDELISYLSHGLNKTAVAAFYSGLTKPLSSIGISEVVLLVQAFNDWLESMRPTWPSCDKLAEIMFEKLKARETAMKCFSYDPGEGIMLNELPLETSSLSKVFMVYIKSLARRHPSPENVQKLFGSVNRENKMALTAAGLGSMMIE